jgi:FKBP-type peptidyl-prolyl cis-trans isomerase FkpA
VSLKLKKLLFVLCITIVAVSCLKSNDQRTCAYPVITKTAPAAEQDSLKAWLDSNNIEAVKHPAGFYYKIIQPGTGSDTMTLCSEILINYSGTYIDGRPFDSGNEKYFVLGALIEGWRKGIPLIKKGGQIKLFLPPSLAYGPDGYVENGQVIIPPNTQLIFDVTLLDYSPGF